MDEAVGVEGVAAGRDREFFSVDDGCDQRDEAMRGEHFSMNAWRGFRIGAQKS